MGDEVKYPEISIKLVGEDGNAFAIIGRITRALKQAGVSQKEIDEYQKESTSSDYDHLLQTAMKWVDIR